uniref:Uncharacterized protein n=1 Tax=Anguilla anguilla TaxID=7936 RepID=A0A0E9S4G3_ANGAN
MQRQPEAFENSRDCYTTFITSTIVCKYTNLDNTQTFHRSGRRHKLRNSKNRYSATTD